VTSKKTLHDTTPAEDALDAAARTMGEMPEDDIRSRFAQLRAAQRARTGLEISRQQAETDSVDLDEAAYLAGLKHEESGDLKAAVRWYRAAAVNDFPQASLKLASALNSLAAEHRARGETHAEEALIDDAHEWAAKAYAAGEDGADLIDDADWPQADPSPDQPAPPQCSLGGLRKAALLDDQDQLAEHLDACDSCQSEQKADDSHESAHISR
jgi:hypothetical protein